MQPRLTTVAQPMRNMGSVAVEALVNYLNHPIEYREMQNIIFPAEIILRESTAPPRSEDSAFFRKNI
jgi:DNA-binding LacI/PurR family transcriptional regulator